MTKEIKNQFISTMKNDFNDSKMSPTAERVKIRQSYDQRVRSMAKNY